MGLVIVFSFIFWIGTIVAWAYEPCDFSRDLFFGASVMLVFWTLIAFIAVLV